MDAIIKFLLTRWAGAPLAIWFLGVPTVLAMLIVWKANPSPKKEPHSKSSHQTENPPPHSGTTQSGKNAPLSRRRREAGRLNANCQFWWGFFGGWIVVLGRLWFYASSLTPDAPWPSIGFRTCLLCVFSLAFPIVSGLVSRVCEPHHRLIAVFEGAAAPALFIEIARDFARVFPL